MANDAPGTVGFRNCLEDAPYYPPANSLRQST